MDKKSFVALLGERQKQIEEDLYAFGEPSGEDPVLKSLGQATVSVLERLKAERDELIRQGTIEDFKLG
jgi:hypothetical protein